MAIRENIFDRMERLNAVKKQCEKNKTSYFVEHGESSTEVLNQRLGENQIVNIVMNDHDGGDDAFVFSLLTTDLQVGDYLTWKDTTEFMIYEQVSVIKEVDYNKFKAYECNVRVNDSFGAHLISSRTSAKDITMSNQFETSKLLFTLVCPISKGLEIDGSIKIDNQLWDIVDADTTSKSGIGFYYIERGTNTMRSIGAMPKDKESVVYSGMKLTIPTENGYYTTQDKVELINRESNQITIKVPRQNFSITVRKDGQDIVKKYTVKENV